MSKKDQVHVFAPSSSEAVRKIEQDFNNIARLESFTSKKDQAREELKTAKSQIVQQALSHGWGTKKLAHALTLLEGLATINEKDRAIICNAAQCLSLAHKLRSLK